MARSQNSFNKKEREKKKQQKRKEKEAKKLEKKEQGTDSSLDSMMVYVDANGNFVDTPPEETNTEETHTTHGTCSYISFKTKKKNILLFVMFRS